MAPYGNYQGRAEEKVGEWRASLLGKGLKLNAEKMKLMVSGGVVSEFGAWP